ncbi:MAG: ABC transporter permease [Anaerolineales bacterium]|nr:ABC transporter permease [Anaerolineales bacterium]
MITNIFTAGTLAATIRIATPLLFAAIGAALSLKVNLFNIAIEGFMLIAAFLAVFLSSRLGDPYLALAITLLITTATGLLYGFVTISLGSDHIIAGLGFNLLATGLTTWVLQSILHSPGGFMDPSVEGLPIFRLSFLPPDSFLGEVLAGHDILTYSAWILAVLAYLFVHQSGAGLRLRATGEHPLAATTAGIRTVLWQYLAAGLTGTFCGLAGASISLSHLQMFSQGMTAGRGFIAFAAATFAAGNIPGTALMAVLFAFFGSVAIRLEGFGLPTQFVQMIPYLVTLMALFFARRRNRQ